MKPAFAAVPALLCFAASCASVPPVARAPSVADDAVVVSQDRLEVSFRWDSTVVAWPTAAVPEYGPPVVSWIVRGDGVHDISFAPAVGKADKAVSVRELLFGATAYDCPPPPPRDFHNVVVCTPVTSSVTVIGDVVTVTVREQGVLQSWRLHRPSRVHLVLWLSDRMLSSDTLDVRYR